MRIVGVVVRGLLGIVLLVIAGLIGFLAISPPELLKVADGYTAKIVCSNAFLAARDPATVLAVDVQAPGNPLLKLIRLSVDPDAKEVTARFLGFSAAQTAIYRDGYGCSLVPDGKVAEAAVQPLPRQPDIAPLGDDEWPLGTKINGAENAKLAAVLNDAESRGPGFRAAVVVRGGKIVAEAYGDGFAPETPLLGWSMTKTVNAALIGRMIALGKMTGDETALFKEWAGDARKDIPLSDLMGMQSGLQFEEEYGDVNDVTRMLFLESNMAAFGVAKQIEAPPGTKFNYSSGTAVLLARYWMNKFEKPAEALIFPRTALFEPLGMTSAVMELDEAGNYVGGSYSYATARDWARFGLFLLQDGVWKGTRLLPEGFVAKMGTPTAASKGIYSQAQTWIAGPGEKPNAEFGIPADTFYALGHDGQSIAVVPSENLVVVRLGLTPDRLNYRPQIMIKNVIAALK